MKIIVHSRNIFLSRWIHSKSMPSYPVKGVWVSIYRHTKHPIQSRSIPYVMPNLPYEARIPKCNAKSDSCLSVFVRACKPNQVNANEHDRQYHMQTHAVPKTASIANLRRNSKESRKRRREVVQWCDGGREV